MNVVPGTQEIVTPPPRRRYDAGARNLEDRMKGNGALFCETYSVGECNVIVAREPAGKHREFLWHLSISHPDRYPTWDEIKTARYLLLPKDICCAMLMPPPEFYVDVQSPLDGSNSTVFHVWEVDDPRKQWETM